MAGKAWCCGGGGGGGSTALAVADTGTAHTILTGTGTESDPYVISADVLLAAEPNGIEAAADGLLVAPSADAGNTLTMGADGRLFVPAPPTPPDPTTLVPVVGGAPAPVGTGRSVDIDITEAPADTWNVGARLSPPWAQVGRTGLASITPGAEAMITELIVPEDGVYYMEALIEGTANIVSQVPSAERYVIGRLKVDGTTMLGSHAVLNRFNTADPESRLMISSVTLPWRQQLTAGQRIQAWVLPFYDANNFADGFGAAATLGYHKISD